MKQGAAIAFGWILCGVVAWGTTLGHFVGQFPDFPHRSHYGIAGFMAVLGPIGMLISAFSSNFWQYGFIWK